MPVLASSLARYPHMTPLLGPTLVSLPALRLNGCAKPSAQVLFTVLANTQVVLDLSA